MSTAFPILVALAGQSVFGGGHVFYAEEYDWERIFDLAQEQEVLPLAWYAVKNAGKCPPMLAASVERTVRSTVVSYYVRSESMIRLLQEAEQAGIPNIRILKGFAIADCYAVPEARISGDIDILIDKKYESAMLRFLEEHRFVMMKREIGRHHSVCVHPNLGTLEVHVALFSREDKTVWLQNVDLKHLEHDAGTEITSPMGTFRTLDLTNHMIFLFLHFLNHFVNTGASLKMIFDVGVFYAVHSQEIDSRRLHDILRQCRGEKLFGSILRICSNFCTVSYPQEDVSMADDALSELLLKDIQTGGVMGGREIVKRQVEKRQNARIKLKRRTGRATYFAYQVRHYLIQAKSYFAPSHNELLQVYPELEQNRICYLRACLLFTRRKIRDYKGRRGLFRTYAIEHGRTEILKKMRLI